MPIAGWGPSSARVTSIRRALPRRSGERVIDGDPHPSGTYFPWQTAWRGRRRFLQLPVVEFEAHMREVAPDVDVRGSGQETRSSSRRRKKGRVRLARTCQPMAIGSSPSRFARWYERLTFVRADPHDRHGRPSLVLVAGALARLVEPEVFTSLGLAYWWAITTVTTVGYGDVVPATAGARCRGVAHAHRS